MSARGEGRSHSANPFQPWLDHNDRGRGMPPAAQQQQLLQQQASQQRVGFVPPPPPRNISRGVLQRGEVPPPVPPRKRPPPPLPAVAEPQPPPPPTAKDSPPPSYSDLYAPPPDQPPRRYSHTAADIQLLPPPRCRPPRKYSEGNVSASGYKFNSKRGATVILPPPINTDYVIEPTPEPDKISERQDSNVSSDSFSQSSSPSYTSKSMEAPLLPNLTKKKRYQIEKELAPIRLERKDDIDTIEDTNTSPIIKSHSTPASLQTIVRLQTGSSVSLHHRIIRDMRRPSSAYTKRNWWRRHCLQLVINFVAIIVIAGGLTIYYKVNPNTTIKYVNHTVLTTKVVRHDLNPAPGLCLPVIVPFCIHHEVPYNFTLFPNFVGHFNQRDVAQDLEVYEALVDVRCYELASLFLCSIFVPKCGANGSMVRPCKSLCFETKRRCGFFLEVFGLTLPSYLDCELFPSSNDTDVCVGNKEVLEAEQRARTPKCDTGFQCDVKRCIPPDWRCDGHVDCEDQSDELECESCPPEMIHCGTKTCITQSHMCDGEVNCPWGQDERNCLRLSEKMGDVGQGKLEIFQPELKSWRPACVKNWDSQSSAKSICNFLGYVEVNSTHLTTKATSNGPNGAQISVRGPIYKKKKSGLSLKDLRNCPPLSYATVNLTCHNALCGMRRISYQPSKRIIGGVRSTPGDWPFLAALLGGPEQVFYCAGVLISDQWVLTASHCVGNFSHGDTSGWTIQLGITRRHAHSYYGQKAKVKRVIPHPMYNIGIAHDNDVALFQLQQKVTFHEHLVPVCLPDDGYVLKPDTMCTVVGWGKREDSNRSEYEATVNEVQVPVLNRSLCNRWLEPRDLNVTPGMICAGYKEGGKDACQGDSGGPLLCRINNTVDKWFVGGIVSWGIKCAHPRLPGVYAYVPHYVPWIKEQMARYSD